MIQIVYLSQFFKIFPTLLTSRWSQHLGTSSNRNYACILRAATLIGHQESGRKKVVIVTRGSKEVSCEDRRCENYMLLSCLLFLGGKRNCQKIYMLKRRNCLLELGCWLGWIVYWACIGSFRPIRLLNDTITENDI